MAMAWEESCGLSVANQLKNAFVEDHRKLTRAYRDIQNELESGNIQNAKRIAEELDQIAGPHIEFEERYLYPIVRKYRGDSYANNLYEEHGAILATIQELKSAESCSDWEQSRWLEGISEGLNHAVTCGTLLSHLATLPVEEQEDLLEKLLWLRENGVAWSQLKS